MAKVEQGELSARQRRAVGWIVNIGLAWALAMSWCGQHWPAFGAYFLSAAVAGALIAMGSAALRAKQDDGDASEEPLVAPGNKPQDVQQRRTEETPIPLEYLSVSRVWGIARLQRTVAELEREHLKQIVTARVLETQSHYDALLLRATALQERNLARHSNRQHIYDLRSLVGPRYTLDFGTVQIDIDGDIAKVNLASSAHVVIDGPKFGSTPYVGLSGEASDTVSTSANKSLN